VLVELETDKITVEVAAPADGTLGKRPQKQEGDTVGVNELLAARVGRRRSRRRGPAAAAVRFREGRRRPGRRTRSGPPPPLRPPRRPPADAQTSPAVRALAAEHGLDLASLRGSGPNGRITKEDVLKRIEDGRAAPALPQREAAAAGAPPPAPTPSRPASTAAPTPAAAVPAERARDARSGCRDAGRPSRRLLEAQHTAASLTTFNEVDMRR
jgi:2-oxoglutarate dehydrogenase E2 component (dihydrolipoamide succinyltransferase)